MDNSKNTDLRSMQLVELAEEVNGNLTLSIGNASLDISLEKLRRYRDMGYPTDFQTLFTVGLMDGGYDESQCLNFYKKMEDDGYDFRLSINQIDEDNPLNINTKENGTLIGQLDDLSGTSNTMHTIAARGYSFG